MKRLITTIGVITFVKILLLIPWGLWGQVINDNIEDRLELGTDGTPYSSNTSHCTVQWECVDQSLTGKCVQYHNDQWFYFNSGEKEQLYLNIYNQTCRDVRGVQVIVLQGTPCEPLTYTIKSCVSLANQDNIFIRLDDLNRNEVYLINIDGYLHDFCEFQLEISEIPKGIPVQPPKQEVHFDFIKRRNLVQITWTIPEGNSYRQYEVHRRKSDQNRSKLIAILEHERNAYGLSKQDYSYQDTLVENGTYFYKIVGTNFESNGYSLIEKEIRIQNDHISGKANLDKLEDEIIVKLDFENKTPLTVLLINSDNQRVLHRQDFTFNQDNNGVYFFIKPFVNQGVTNFEVRVVDVSSSKRKSYYFTK